MNASPELFDFDAWRANYDSMTYQDHLDVYSELWKLYPVQQHFDVAACRLFLDRTLPVHVTEIGGWDGELAALMLEERTSALRSWTNVEICREVAEPLLDDTRYISVCNTRRFIWESPHIYGADALVMSHSAEHMRWAQLQTIFGIGSMLRAIYLASPLPEDGSAPDWNHYPGTHILEVGWDTIGAFLGGLGFRQMEAPRTHEVRAWAKP